MIATSLVKGLVAARLYSDNFNRADEDPCTGWTQVDTFSSDFRVSTNQLIAKTTDNKALAYLDAAPTCNNFDIYVTMIAINGSASQINGAAFIVDGSNYYIAGGIDDTNQICLMKSGTIVATAGSLTSGNDYTARFLKQGTALKVKVWSAGSGEPGTWDIEYTDSTPLSNGRCGIGSTATSGVRNPDAYDDFSVYC